MILSVIALGVIALVSWLCGKDEPKPLPQSLLDLLPEREEEG